MGYMDAAKNYGGLQDIQATIPRHFAFAYFGRWALLTAGTIPLKPETVPEELLGAILEFLDIPVGFFSAVASLSPDKRWHSRYKHFLHPDKNSSAVFRWQKDEKE